MILACREKAAGSGYCRGEVSGVDHGRSRDFCSRTGPYLRYKAGKLNGAFFLVPRYAENFFVLLFVIFFVIVSRFIRTFG